MATERLRPFFPYYGGKFRAAPRYPEPLNDWIVEPFAGSAGYSLRYPDRQVVLVEACPDIAAIWTYLTLASPREILRLPLLEPGQTAADAKAPAEARVLIGMWLDPGSTHPKPNRRFTVDPRYGSLKWGARARERIASQVDRIRHWIVKCGDYTAAPRKVRATWFIDPPYQRMGVHYRFGSNRIDYSSLAHWCKRQRGQVIVCEGSGGDWLPFESFGLMRAKRGHAPELLWQAQQR